MMVHVNNLGVQCAALDPVGVDGLWVLVNLGSVDWCALDARRCLTSGLRA